MKQQVCVLGLGYVGLPMAAILANRGFQVIGVDVNPAVIETVRQGGVHIVEPELDVAVRAATHSGQLRAVAEPEPADVFVITVPTPFTEGYAPDLSYIESAVRAIAPVVQIGNLVVLESTSPVGTTEQLVRWLSEDRPDLAIPQRGGAGHDVHVAYCPERVLPGHAIHELIHNDRVIGGITPCCAAAATGWYRQIIQGQCYRTDSRTAEMVKLAENAYRDVNIAFANELALLCDHSGVDVWDLISLANHHPRVDILKPGPGVGGHCVAVDPWFLWSTAPELARLIHAARTVNDEQPQRVVAKVRAAVARVSNPVIACFGLTYKADIDDLRHSPALQVVEAIAAATSGPLLVVEPHVARLPDALQRFPQIRLVDVSTALREANIIVGLVDHQAFTTIPLLALQEKAVVDTKGMW